MKQVSGLVMSVNDGLLARALPRSAPAMASGIPIDPSVIKAASSPFSVLPIEQKQPFSAFGFAYPPLPELEELNPYFP
jgi:hypothetical protein